MLSPRLTDCPNCPNLPDLISDIDCKLSELGTNLYNNVVFSLNNNIPAVAIIDLLNYKRILTFKLCNPDYASGCGYNVQTIASKVRLLTSDANNCCRNNKILSNTPTNTTTTSSSTSSSTSSTSTTSSTSSTTSSSTTIPPSGCGCYDISVQVSDPPVPLIYIPCGGGSPVSIDFGSNKYCVSSIVSLGNGTATPIIGSSCTSNNDCRPCRCYEIIYNNIANTLISYIDCDGFPVIDRLITQDTRLCAQENSITFIFPANLTVTDVNDCANCPITPPATGGPFSINWTTTVNNPCDSTPWTINPNNLVVRYDVTDSLNCGGTCDSTQSGTATATIQTGPVDLNLTITVTGLVELQIAGYERLPIIIDGIEVQTYMSPGGLLGCAMGAPISVTYTPGPYTFLAGSAHTVELDFSTMDQSFHVGAYYEITLTFT